jgi:hypothetical protein
MKHQSTLQQSLDAGGSAYNYSPFEISSAAMERAEQRSLLNINENDNIL